MKEGKKGIMDGKGKEQAERRKADLFRHKGEEGREGERKKIKENRDKGKKERKSVIELFSITLTGHIRLLVITI